MPTAIDIPGDLGDPTWYVGKLPPVEASAEVLADACGALSARVAEVYKAGEDLGRELVRLRTARDEAISRYAKALNR